MSVIDKARELGAVLQQDSRYNAYVVAKAANDSDGELQQLIEEFNVTRGQLNVEMSKSDKDSEKVSQLDTKLRELYNDVMTNPHMEAFEAAKADMDDLLESINYIITAAANGMDPLTCPERDPHSCGCDCSSCGGCH
ncbi:MAG: YlbF family regulator [Oscillospiraceae bacterium]|nr:YlbF family regulator [Oscillospiraceae bacterium]